jgi:hypothetical protein
MQGWFNIQKYTKKKKKKNPLNVIHVINKLKEKNEVIISLDVEKAFDKIHLFMLTI